MPSETSHLQPDWGRLFGSDPYRFQMGLRAGDARKFFSGTAEGARLLPERRRWLELDQGRYCQLGSDSAIEELERLTEAWGLGASAAGSAVQRLTALGVRLEPDFLLLGPSQDGPFRLLAGVVCFPSSWALEEKMGRPMAEIHGIVPGLNTQLGPQIDRFLERLNPATAWERANWGLSADAELNRHPARGLPTLKQGATLRDTWLRVEHQSLSRMSESGGVLFGIRLSVHRLDQLAHDETVAEGLARSLETMSPEVAGYKGLAACRDGLVRLLRTRFT